MKRWILLLALLFGFVASPAFAVVSTKEDSVYKGDAVHLDFQDSFSVEPSASDDSTKVVKFSSAYAEKTIQFSPDEFMIVFNNPDDSAEETFIPLSISTKPDYIKPNGENSSAGFIRWQDGEDTKIQKTFRVPRDYKSGGSFRVLLGRSSTDICPSIDFEVFVNRTATALDTSATNQTPVLAASHVGDGSAEESTLTIVTDFASLAAGDYVTVNLWRTDADSPASTGDLRLYWAEFVYSTTD